MKLLRRFKHWVRYAISPYYRSHCRAEAYLRGIRNAETEAKIEELIQKIATIQLPPRYPMGDPRNIERVTSFIKQMSEKEAK